MTQPTPPPLPDARVAPEPVTTPGSSALWVLAFAFFPFGTIIYMAVLRIVSFWLSAVLFLISLALCFAVDISSPWSMLFVSILLYAIGVLQFILGHRKRIWSPRALRIWRSLAILGAILTLLTPWLFAQLSALLTALTPPDSLDF